MASIEDLEEQLKGATHINMRQFAQEHFTPEFLEEFMQRYDPALVFAGTGLSTNHKITELEKAVIHYCSWNLIVDLWQNATPQLQEFIQEDGHFNLEMALEVAQQGSMTDDIMENLVLGALTYGKIVGDIYDNWVRDLGPRNEKNDSNDITPLFFKVYKLYTLAIEGDWYAPTLMDGTFSSAGLESWYWTRDYPHFTREEIENIGEKSIDRRVEMSKKLAIASGAFELVTQQLAEQGELMYIFDKDLGTVIENPEHQGLIAQRIQQVKPIHHDQTSLQLNCPANYVPSQLYGHGNVLRDITKFRNSLFVEVYLETQNMR